MSRTSEGADWLPFARLRWATSESVHTAAELQDEGNVCSHESGKPRARSHRRARISFTDRALTALSREIIVESQCAPTRLNVPRQHNRIPLHPH
jgi:hypothetical protein